MKNNIEIREIHTITDLVETMRANDENIVYGAGYMAHIMMKYLFFRGIHRLVLCLTVEDDSVNPTEIYETPVVDIRYLPHFYQTASFYLGLSEEAAGDVIDVLCEKGCRNIYRVSNDVFRGMIGEFEKTSSNIIADVALRSNEYLTQRAKNEILWQSEVVKANTDSFENFRDANKGKDIVLLATGPTASKYKVIENVRHIGVNTTPILGIQLDYYFAHDSRAFKKITLNEVINKCKGDVFIGRIAYRLAYLRSEIDISNIERTDIHQYFVNAPCMTDDLVKDICMHALTDYYSIVFSAMQFAFFTRPSKIYLVGCDVSGRLEHFNERSIVTVPHSKYFKLGYGLMKRFGEVYYPEVEIISVNPVGLKGLFEDYYQDE